MSSFGKPLDGTTSKKANTISIEYRRARAKLKHDIKQGAKDISDVQKMLSATKGSKIYAYMRLKGLLTAFPGIGTKRAQEFAEANELELSKRIGGLGVRQWAVVIKFTNSQ